jgi:hypothetical protein
MMNRFAMLSLFIAVCSCVYQAHAFSTSFSHDSKSRALNPVLVPPVIAARTRNGLSFSSLSLFRNRIRRKQQQASCHSDNDSNSGDDLIPDKTTERTLLSKKLRNLVPTRKKLKRLVFTMTIFLFSSPALARSSGGRIGGSSFRSRPSMSRPIRHSYRPPRRSLGQPIYRAPPTRLHYRPPIYRPRIYNRPTVVLRGEDYALQQTAEGPYASIRSRPRKRISVSDLVLVTGTGVAITYKVMDHYYKKDYNDENESPLGPGMSVASLTVAMQVPDRTDSNSILVDLERRAQTAQTNTQRGLQTLVSEIALELLRKESSIFSVESSVTHHRSMTEAERTFQRLSVRQRGKLDRESGRLNLSKHELTKSLLFTNQISLHTFAYFIVVQQTTTMVLKTFNANKRNPINTLHLLR